MAYIHDTYALIDSMTQTCLLTMPVSMVNPPFAMHQQVDLYHIVTGVSLGVWRVIGVWRRLPFREDRTDPSVRVPLHGGEIQIMLVQI